MRCSVLIPTYNSEKVIGYTLDSVLSQTHKCDEILVWDDGSSDSTLSILRSYGTSLTVIQSHNGGVANARNQLCARATGDILAFLDHDDLWHKDYLREQLATATDYPQAVAFYTGHLNFYGMGEFDWSKLPLVTGAPEVLSPKEFLFEYNRATGRFASMSYCCLRRSTLDQLNCEPFHPALSGVDDSYLASLLPLAGPVAYNPNILACYRITETAQSSNRLKMVALWVQMFELLADRYEAQATPDLRKTFKQAYASKRRQYAKMFLGVGRMSEARDQLLSSLLNCGQPSSLIKSLGLLAASLLPQWLQPAWPSSVRVFDKPSNSNAGIRNQ